MEPAAGEEGRGGEIKERAWGGGGTKRTNWKERRGKSQFSFLLFARGMT